MKRLVILIAMAVSIIGLTACGSDSSNSVSKEKDTGAESVKQTPTSTNEVETESESPSDALETEKYLNEVKESYVELAELGERWDELREASAAGEIDDYELGNVIYEEILPANMTLLEDLEAIRPPNDETTEVNEILIEAIGNQQLAFTEILSAIETGDSSKITSANALLNDVRKSDREFARKIEHLISKYNLEF